MQYEPVLLHTFPHSPQLLGSCVTSTQTEPHRRWLPEHPPKFEFAGASASHAAAPKAKRQPKTIELEIRIRVTAFFPLLHVLRSQAPVALDRLGQDETRTTPLFGATLIVLLAAPRCAEFSYLAKLHRSDTTQGTPLASDQ
jgi:hypothetical protein